jgi:hypothetical protein
MPFFLLPLIFQSKDLTSTKTFKRKTNLNLSSINAFKSPSRQLHKFWIKSCLKSNKTRLRTADRTGRTNDVFLTVLVDKESNMSGSKVLVETCSGLPLMKFSFSIAFSPLLGYFLDDWGSILQAALDQFNEILCVYHDLSFMLVLLCPKSPPSLPSSLHH